MCRLFCKWDNVWGRFVSWRNTPKSTHSPKSLPTPGVGRSVITSCLLLWRSSTGKTLRINVITVVWPLWASCFLSYDGDLYWKPFLHVTDYSFTQPDTVLLLWEFWDVKKKWMWQIWFTEAVWRRRCLDSSVAKDVRYNKCKAVPADVVVWWKTGLREASTNQPPSVKVQGLWEYFKTPVRVPTGEQAARNGAGSTIDTARLAWHPVFTVYRLNDWLTAIKASAQKYCLSCSSC